MKRVLIVLGLLAMSLSSHPHSRLPVILSENGLVIRKFVDNGNDCYIASHKDVDLSLAMSCVKSEISLPANPGTAYYNLVANASK